MKDLSSETIEMNVGEEIGSKEEEIGDESFPSIRSTETPSLYHLVPDMEIKHEEIDFHYNNTSTSDTEVDSEFKAVSSIQNIDCTSINDEFLNDFYLDLHQCDKNCETCLKYMRILIEHVRATHAPPQPIQDPLLIDPLDIDTDLLQAHQSSSVQIKCEVEETIENESDDYPEYSPSTHSIRNAPKISGNKTTKSKESLAVHEKTKAKDTGEKRFKCDICEKTFRRKNNLTAHKLIHAGKKSHVCKDCGLGFISLARLTPHIASHREEKPFKCDLCEIGFRKARRLTEHKRVHTGERPFKCYICEKGFMSVGGLNSHKKVHTGERPHKCDQCEKSFSKNDDFNKHMAIHSGERPHVCDQCGKGFSLRSGLITHRIIHTGEKPIKCDMCVKSFRRTSDLNKHKVIHLEERPYKCAQCDMSFKRADVLSGHNKRIHTRRETVELWTVEVPKDLTSVTSVR